MRRQPANVNYTYTLILRRSFPHAELQVVESDIPREISRKLQEIHKQQNITPKMCRFSDNDMKDSSSKVKQIRAM